MPNLINFVADMTGQRDRDLVEVTVADVMFRLLKARRLAWWRLIEHPQGARLRLMAGLTSNQPVAMSDPHVEPEDLPRVDEHEGFGSCVDDNVPLQLSGGGAKVTLFPVNSEREVVGVVEVETDAPVTEAQRELVDGLLRIHRNHLALLDYSEHDTLTGLLNRKTFDDIFARRVAKSSIGPEYGKEIELVGRRRIPRPDETAWIAVVDIDHFKRINDRYGHLFGDEVLLLMARLMRSAFRTSDVLFRFGGEEFVVLLALSDAAGTETALERFRYQVEAFDFPQVGDVTVSIGFSRATVRDTPEAAFERADEALYYAKQNGRNQVRSYEALRDLGVIAPKKVESGEIELF